MEEDVQVLPVNKVLPFTYDNTLGGSECTITIINNLPYQICFKISTNRKEAFLVLPTKKIIDSKSKEAVLIRLESLLVKGQQEAKMGIFKIEWCKYETKVYN